MDRLRKLIERVRPYYTSTDPAHDWPHIGRVAALAKKLCDEEKIGSELVLAAVYCHDLVSYPKDHPDRKLSAEHAARDAGPILKEAGFNEEEILRIQTLVVEHSFSKGLKPSSVEAGIVQDADRLDALGAIGILRCASVNTQMKTSFYDPFDPLAELRPLDDKNFLLDHYSVKLFKLPELMNTKSGKIEGQRRCDYMKAFVAELMNEIRISNR